MRQRSGPGSAVAAALGCAAPASGRAGPAVPVTPGSGGDGTQCGQPGDLPAAAGDPAALLPPAGHGPGPGVRQLLALGAALGSADRRAGAPPVQPWPAVAQAGVQGQPMIAPVKNPFPTQSAPPRKRRGAVFPV